MYDLAVERLTGMPTESFTSNAMQWGVDNEPLARAAYEVRTSKFVSQVPFVFHPNIPNGGCSPDGLVDDDLGLIEIKCPLTKTHLKWVMADKPAQEYVNQMMWQMACTGRHYVDFVSFDPRLPDDLQLFIRRLVRDEEYINKITQEVIKFDKEVDVLLTKLKEINNG